MPRKRNGRSASPTKQPTNGSNAKDDIDKNQIFQHVSEMFQGQVDSEVVHLVLTECDWRGEVP